MPLVTYKALPHSLAVRVALDVPRDQKRLLRKARERDKRKIPQPVEALGAIDTLAGHTCVETSIVEALGLVQVGEDTFYRAGPDPNVTCAIYNACLTIMQEGPDRQLDLVLDPFPVASLAIGSDDYQVVLGLDFLSHCLLFYDGESRVLWLKY